MNLRGLCHKVVQFGFQQPDLGQVLLVLGFPVYKVGDEMIPPRLPECEDLLFCSSSLSLKSWMSL